MEGGWGGMRLGWCAAGAEGGCGEGARIDANVFYCDMITDVCAGFTPVRAHCFAAAAAAHDQMLTLPVRARSRLQMQEMSDRYEIFIKRLELSQDPAAKEYLRTTNAQMLEGACAATRLSEGQNNAGLWVMGNRGAVWHRAASEDTPLERHRLRAE